MNITEAVKATEAELEKLSGGKLVEEIKSNVADAEELVKATASQTGEGIAAARSKAEESLKAAKARLAKHERAVMERTRAAAKATADCVCSNPWKALGIAAGVGFVLCLLETSFGHPVIEAGERMIIKGGRGIKVAEKEVQKLFQ
jgi:ElaB/YqjD/DUF883 family membrane-anchored ribosome-binding protein